MYSLGLWCGRKYGFVDVYITVTNMTIFDCFYNLFFVYKFHPSKIFFRFSFLCGAPIGRMKLKYILNLLYIIICFYL